MRDVSHWMTLNHILYVTESVWIIQLGYDNGELPHMSTTPHTKAVNVQTGDRIEDMIRDLGQ